MEATVEYLGGSKFDIIARSHRIRCDQPCDNHGANTGMTPPELLLASLGSCAGYYAAEYLRARSLPTKPLRIHVSAEKAAKPVRLGSFRIRVEVPNVEVRHRDLLLKVVKQCLIHNTLLHVPSIEVVLEVGKQTAAA